MNHRKVGYLFTSILIVLATHAVGQQVRRIDDAALKNTRTKGEEWLSTGLSPDESRYSSLREINTSNVSRVAFQWSYDIGSVLDSFGRGGVQEATPLFANGTLYGITNWSVVFAVDARTGKEKWRWDPEVNQTAVG